MSRFDITHEEGLLTLTLAEEERRLITGLLLFFLAFCCDLVIGGLAVLFQAQPTRPQGGVAAPDFFDPQGNHLGFLWLVGTLLMLVFAPFYFARVRNSKFTFSFDRATNLFRQNRKVISRLNNIEYICVRRIHDADQRELYRPIVIYGDGFETCLDESYDEVAVYALAREVAEFLDVQVVCK